MSAPAAVPRTTTREARVTSRASKHFYLNKKRGHLSHVLFCLAMLLNRAVLFSFFFFFSPCLLHSLSNPVTRLLVNMSDWAVVLWLISPFVVSVWLSEEKRHGAGRSLADSSEPQAADGDFPGGGATWGAGPLPLHHPVPQGRRYLQLWRAHRQR